MMLAMTLVIALVTGGYFVLSKNEADGPQEIAGSFVPGKPKIEMIDSDNSGVPTWQLSNVFGNGNDSRRWGRADLIWPNGERLECKDEEVLSRPEVCGLKVEYVQGDSIFQTEIVECVGECAPVLAIDYKLLLGEILNSPFSSNIPYSALEGCQLIFRGSRRSPIGLGLDIRLEHLRGNKVVLISTDKEIAQKILRFK